MDRNVLTAVPAKRLAFTLEPVPPFRLDLTVWTLRRRPDNAVDLWDGETYQRVVMPAGIPVSVAVTQVGPPDHPCLQVEALSVIPESDIRRMVTTTLEHLLGLRIDLSEFYRLAAKDSRLAPLAQRFYGLKPPRFPTPFEALVNAVACQQITLTQGIRLLNRLAEALGPTGPGVLPISHALPDPAELAEAELEVLRGLGFSGQKARALVEAARRIVGGEIALDELAQLDEASTVAGLRQLRGVGRWSAEYVMLRGFGQLQVFPGDDVGARNNLQRWLGVTEEMSYDSVQRIVAPWHPYAGLVYFHLLLNRLTEVGLISAPTRPVPSGNNI